MLHGNFRPEEGVFKVKISVLETGGGFGSSDLIVQNENLSAIGQIPEDDNRNVGTQGRGPIMVDGQPYNRDTYINLVSLLTKLVESSGQTENGKKVGYFHAKVRRCDSKLQIDVERMVD